MQEEQKQGETSDTTAMNDDTQLPADVMETCHHTSYKLHHLMKQSI
jgi:hypothetical protein